MDEAAHMNEFKEMLDTLPVGVYSVGQDGIIEYANKKCEEISGSNSADLKKINVFSWEPYQYSGLAQKVREALTEGKTFEASFSYTHPHTKETIWRQYRGVPVKDPSGAVAHVLVLLEDATPQKQAEDILMEKVEELQEVGTVKSDFILLASHQLRTPLTTMRWNVERLLRKGNLTDDIRDGLSTVLKSTEHLIDLANDILDASRIETGKERVVKENFTLASVIRDVVDGLAPQAAMRNQKIVITCPPSLHVFADPKLFARVLENLIHNAITYAFEESDITVTATRDADTIRITVHNFGIVIPEEDRAKLFTRFHRTDEAQSKVPNAHSGLGLFIAHAAAEANGGTLKLAQSNDTGTVFEITLPAKAA